MSDTPESAGAEASSRARASPFGLRWWHEIIIWIVFVLICFGLGYPTLSRYDATRTEGLSDTVIYQQMVVGLPSSRPRAEVFGGRILVPYTARLVYAIARSRLQSWNPVAFSMLVTNSLFCATTAFLLVITSSYVVRSYRVSLLAANLYLLSFAIPNLQLAGLIDSGEALFMLAVTWSLITGKWWLLPALGVGGALAKETFVPFATVFALAWWVVTMRERPLRWTRGGWIAAMFLSGNVTLILVSRSLFGHVIWPWQIASAMNSRTGFALALWGCITDRSFWYVFLWLLPLGLLGLKGLPRAWKLSSAITALVALTFGAYNNMAGTVGRPIFDIIGPMLSLSTALFLTGLPKPPSDEALR